jgi:hypothetical protein
MRLMHLVIWKDIKVMFIILRSRLDLKFFVIVKASTRYSISKRRRKMWITTQSKKVLINSDNIIMIFATGGGDNIIKARIVNATEKCIENITLGEYKDKDTCLKILEHLSLVVGSDIPAITMPLNDEVEKWLKDVEDIATACIIKNFRR